MKIWNWEKKYSLFLVLTTNSNVQLYFTVSLSIPKSDTKPIFIYFGWPQYCWNNKDANFWITHVNQVRKKFASLIDFYFFTYSVDMIVAQKGHELKCFFFEFTDLAMQWGWQRKSSIRKLLSHRQYSLRTFARSDFTHNHGFRTSSYRSHRNRNFLRSSYSQRIRDYRVSF